MISVSYNFKEHSMNRRSLPEDDELVHLKRKAELAKCIEELKKRKGRIILSPSTFATFHLPIYN